MEFKVPETLETERLILRQFRNEDSPDLHAYYSDTSATQYTTGRAFTESETWRVMCTMLGHWQIHNYGPYALEEKETGSVLGTVGFWYPHDWPSPEIKWALAPRYWGKGFAGEAAREVQKTGKSYLPDISLISLIHPQNIPSQKLALSVGATLESTYDFRNELFHVYRHP